MYCQCDSPASYMLLSLSSFWLSHLQYHPCEPTGGTSATPSTLPHSQRMGWMKIEVTWAYWKCNSSMTYRKLRRHQALHDGADRHHADGAAVPVVEDEGPGRGRHGNRRQGADWLAGGAAPRDGPDSSDAGTVWAHVGWKGSTPPEKKQTVVVSHDFILSLVFRRSCWRPSDQWWLNAGECWCWYILYAMLSITLF